MSVRSIQIGRIPCAVPFVVLKLSPEIPDVAVAAINRLNQCSLAFIARTPQELSILAPEDEVDNTLLEAAEECGNLDRGWIGYMVVGPMEFTLVGIMARIAQCLANANVSLLAQSTFDTDYVFVKETSANSAEQAFNSSNNIELISNSSPLLQPFRGARKIVTKQSEQVAVKGRINIHEPASNRMARRAISVSLVVISLLFTIGR